jgi:hypothetical protein
LCLLGEFNSLVLDFVARQKIGGTHLTFTYLKQLPIIPPSRFRTRDIDFIAKRVFELTYTAWDLQSFAQDMGYDGPPFRWEEDRRAQLRAELDAYYARLYGVDREELRYILDPQDVYGPDFPSEAFRVLKEKEIKQCGEYRTRRLVLEAWDRMQEAVDSNTDYVPMADPPPAHPSLAHPNRDGSVYKGPGLVIDTEPIGLERPRPTVKEQPTGYERKAREKTKEEKPAAKEKPTEISDYGLYKCSGCGQMVLGFDKENHVQLLHGGEEQEFVRL